MGKGGYKRCAFSLLHIHFSKFQSSLYIIYREYKSYKQTVSLYRLSMDWFVTFLFSTLYTYYSLLTGLAIPFAILFEFFYIGTAVPFACIFYFFLSSYYVR